jgi:hypothetical protein
MALGLLAIEKGHDEKFGPPHTRSMALGLLAIEKGMMRSLAHHTPALFLAWGLLAIEKWGISSSSATPRLVWGLLAIEK